MKTTRSVGGISADNASCKIGLMFRAPLSSLSTAENANLS